MSNTQNTFIKHVDMQSMFVKYYCCIENKMSQSHKKSIHFSCIRLVKENWWEPIRNTHPDS